MRYYLKFYDNNNELIISTSDITFMGRDLNIPELKERFNKNFVKSVDVKSVEITFLGDNINKSFIAGVRNKHIVIIDKDTNKEYSPKEFSTNLNSLEITMIA